MYPSAVSIKNQHLFDYIFMYEIAVKVALRRTK